MWRPTGNGTYPAGRERLESLADGGKRDRTFVPLDSAEAPLDLSWLRVQGIYREREFP